MFPARPLSFLSGPKAQIPRDSKGHSPLFSLGLDFTKNHQGPGVILLVKKRKAFKFFLWLDFSP